MSKAKKQIKRLKRRVQELEEFLENFVPQVQEVVNIHNTRLQYIEERGKKFYGPFGHQPLPEA